MSSSRTTSCSANCFLFGDLKTPEKNKRYAETFGTLFNAVTVPFYWKTLEPEQGKPRYTADSPYEYRRPPTDPVVAYMESRGVNINGHAIIYGMRAGPIRRGCRKTARRWSRSSRSMSRN